MYIAYISLLVDLSSSLCGGEHCFVFTLTPLLMIDKKGEKYLVYMHVFLSFIHKGGERIFVYAYYFVLQIGEKEFDEFYA